MLSFLILSAVIHECVFKNTMIVMILCDKNVKQERPKILLICCIHFFDNTCKKKTVDI